MTCRKKYYEIKTRTYNKGNDKVVKYILADNILFIIDNVEDK